MFITLCMFKGTVNKIKEQIFTLSEYYVRITMRFKFNLYFYTAAQKKTDSVPYIYCYIFYTKVTLLKDARSVSVYSYNQSQILQNVKYTKLINIAKGFAKFVKNNVFMDKK